MSRFAPLLADIYDAVAAIPGLTEKMAPGDWLSVGIPPSPDQPEAFPVVRIDRYFFDDERQQSYPMELKLWAIDDGDKLAFLDLAEAFKDALNNKSKLIVSSGYVPRHEPDEALFCAVFSVTAYLG